MTTNRKPLERALMGATAVAVPAALIFMLAGPHVDLFGPQVGLLVECAIALLVMLLGAFLAIKQMQPFRWLERRLGL
jgi:hypothetical protein